ncbi:MAG: alpha/beta fold hydrolase [Armatimonadetes bacterium]|nr:alpha/beta fold hydrolase [Armatimonadota bacterium]
MKTRLLILWFLLALIGVRADQVGTASRDVEFSRAGMTFPGTLEYPARTARMPAVVLVHGSGPNDRDETLHDGPVELRPFRELSRELAARGFVVLRYDKRSYLLGKNGDLEGTARLLPRDYVEDARAAIEFLRQQPEVDPRRILLVGHSQGASLAPWVAEGEGLFGAVLLAPGLLTMKDQIEYQTTYQEKFLEPFNHGGVLDPQLAQIRAARQQFRDLFARIESGELADDERIMGASVRYFKETDLLSGQAPERIAAMDVPVLVINGTADLKTPAELLREKEGGLRVKQDLTIVYQPGMIHELYRQGTIEFETAVATGIAEWFARLAVP